MPWRWASRNFFFFSLFPSGLAVGAILWAFGDEAVMRSKEARSRVIKNCAAYVLSDDTCRDSWSGGNRLPLQVVW